MLATDDAIVVVGNGLFDHSNSPAIDGGCGHDPLERNGFGGAGLEIETPNGVCFGVSNPEILCTGCNDGLAIGRQSVNEATD